MEFCQALESVNHRIAEACKRVGRSTTQVTLVGASKSVDASRLAACCQSGLKNVGENYVQEAQEKLNPVRTACPDVTWHFIGALQSNKAAFVAREFALVHSVDRISLARALDAEAARALCPLEILLQVNVGGEASKAGVAPAGLADLFLACRDLPHLRVKGLMALPPFRPNPEASRPFHRELKELRDQLVQDQGDRNSDLEWLSMGMSNDFEVAIEEGSTHVRIGTALFGARG